MKKNIFIFFSFILLISFNVIGLEINLEKGLNPSSTNATFYYSNQSGLIGVDIYSNKIISKSNESNITSLKEPVANTNYTIFREIITSHEINTLNDINNWSIVTNYESASTNDNSILIFIAQGQYYWNWTNLENYFNASNVYFEFVSDNDDVNILNLFARNLTFYNNKSLLTKVNPTCTSDGYTYSAYDYNMHKSSNNISCTAIGYDSIEFNPNITYPDSSVYYFEPNSLTLNFTENTDGFIKTIINIEEFSNVSELNLYQRNLSEGKVAIEFNPDKTEKFQQIFAYDNDGDTTINEQLLVETVDLQQTIKITADTQAIENTRVCAKHGYTSGNTTEWMTTYCDFTNDVGDVIIKVQDGNTYLFCTQADGYESKCELHHIPENNQDTITINLVSTNTKIGTNTFSTSCSTIFESNEICSLTVATYKPYSSICVNATRTISNTSLSTIVCESDSIAEIFSYTIDTNYDYEIGVYLDAELVKTYYHKYDAGVSSNDINYDTGNNAGNTILEKIGDNLPLYIAIHIVLLILGVLAGYMFDKYFNGFGIYGAGIWFLFLGMGQFYIFYVPAIVIIVYFITEKVLPMFQN